ncbi:hypothetical protein AB0C44_19295 [Micromonospora taraxaci]|uniref:hypothetical protein n=1 Tax=Micromonospora taraxaci TaxID=1316803 RepID=UPI0033DC72EA
MAVIRRLCRLSSGRGGSCLVAGLSRAAGVGLSRRYHLTTLPPAREGALRGCGGGCDGRILRYVYIAGLLHFQQAFALRMTLRPQYVAVNNKTK